MAEKTSKNELVKSSFFDILAKFKNEFCTLKTRRKRMYETEKWLVYEQDDFLEDVEILVKKLRECQELPSLLPSVKFDGIYGIPAGGLVLAVYLHYRLKLPLMLAPTENTLVVDDIIDKGFMMSHYIVRGNFTVALFCKIGGKWKPNIWLREKYDKWIRFPWEGEEEYVKLIINYKSPWEGAEQHV